MPFDSNQYNNFELVKTHFHGTFLLGTILNFLSFVCQIQAKLETSHAKKETVE